MRFLHSYHLVVTNPLLFVWFMIWYRTPVESKRLCVMASLYARLTNTNEDNMENLEQLNEALGLSRDTKALRFPALIAPWIWKTVIPFQRVDLTDTEHYISRLVKKTPCWLWYSDLETRREDMKRLVEFCSNKTITTC